MKNIFETVAAFTILIVTVTLLIAPVFALVTWGFQRGVEAFIISETAWRIIGGALKSLRAKKSDPHA